MKYVAIIDSDDELSEDAIKAIKDTVFVEDEKTPYCVDITSIKEVPSPPSEYGIWLKLAYKRALRDCGVLVDDH